MKKRAFALIGAAGFIAPRHMKAIKDTGNDLVAIADPHDSVGVVDEFFPSARYFPEIERFDRHLEKLRRSGNGIDFLAVCSPNYLHDAHVRLGLRTGASVICEKPLVINPWNLDALQEIEDESAGRVFSVFQLRYLPSLQKLRETHSNGHHEIELSYITRRGSWYDVSWKGDEDCSGGLAMNIGIHFFDLAIWLFGAVKQSRVFQRDARVLRGELELERATLKWLLSVDESLLPDSVKEAGGHAYRSMTIDRVEIDMSAGFTDLHTRVYEEVLADRGMGISAARPAVEAIYDIRTMELSDE